jgi:hypothetical protein
MLDLNKYTSICNAVLNRALIHIDNYYFYAEIVKVGKVNEGYFHGWCKEPYFTENSFLTKTYALVELSNGSVELLEPASIRFAKPYGKFSDQFTSGKSEAGGT